MKTHKRKIRTKFLRRRTIEKVSERIKKRNTIYRKRNRLIQNTNDLSNRQNKEGRTSI